MNWSCFVMLRRRKGKNHFTVIFPKWEYRPLAIFSALFSNPNTVLLMSVPNGTRHLLKVMCEALLVMCEALLVMCEALL